jgi:CshA-type fibril repeat protein
MLDNADVPPGTTVSVTGFSVPGSDTIYPAGSTVSLTDPATGATTGTMVVNADGSYVFTPALNYIGPVPAVTVTVASSDGQEVLVPLTLSVNPMLLDGNESPSTTAGTLLITNILANAVVPPGTTVNVTSFTLPGSGVVYPAGPTPVPVVDPVTRATAGTVVVQSDGTVTFTPAPGFTGQAPAIQYTVTSSDGQTSPSALSVTVLSGKHHCEQ